MSSPGRSEDEPEEKGQGEVSLLPSSHSPMLGQAR